MLEEEFAASVCIRISSILNLLFMGQDKNNIFLLAAPEHYNNGDVEVIDIY